MNSNGEPGGGKPAEILVVEDDSDLREAICETFSDHSMSAVGVENGEAALAYLLSSPAPRLVVTDIQMPGMDGWELLEQMRQHRLSSIPVVILSAFVMNAVFARPDGIQFHVRKPFQPAVLVGYARRFCRR